MPRADEAPDHAERDEPDDAEADADVDEVPVVLFAGEERAEDEEREAPVEHPHGEIPDVDAGTRVEIGSVVHRADVSEPSMNAR